VTCEICAFRAAFVPFIGQRHRGHFLHRGRVTLRFDDRLETTLRQVDDNGYGAAAKWQQLVDILAQNPKNFDPKFFADGLNQVRQLIPSVAVEVREGCIRGLAGRIFSSPLVLLLSSDVPSVCAAVIDGARLDDAEWAEIIPHLSVRARGFLRNRRDTGPLTARALMTWASADFVLAARTELRAEAPPVQAPVYQANVQIRDIVERIERLRLERQTHEAPFLPFASDEFVEPWQDINEIRFETDENGVVGWVDGAPPGAIVGVDIAEPAFGNGPGPDANGAAAFRQRMPLENARMRLCGAPVIAGDWRINAAPFFDSISGRFNGYRGIFRRPTIAESAQIAASSSVHADNIQQLVHELRTPLGAIIGFSEIIEQQLFGPVTEEYRILAQNILSDAQRLLAGFDDLGIAAKVESGRFTAQPGVTESDWLSARLAERLQGLSDVLGVTLNLVHAHPVRPFAIDNETAERLFSRLLSAVITGCEPNEILDGRFRTEPGRNAINRFVLSLPRKLLELDEAELFESGPAAFDDTTEAPLLGLGFSLRLVRSLARNVGGDLRFYNEALILSLPAVNGSQNGNRNEERE
jgi:His Kinase A (phospho-acceptor) domain